MTPKQFDELHRNPIKIAVLGHTNHGKTTTVRTLVCDENIGKVSNRANVTEDPERYDIGHAGKQRYTVFDTAGFTAFSRRISEFKKQAGDRTPSLSEFADFLRAKDDRVFRYMAEALDCAADSDVIVFVLDSTQPISTEYTEEIVYLQRCGIPLVVSLNCLYGRDGRKSLAHDWDKHLGEHGLNTVVRFDAHRLTIHDEENLLLTLRAVVKNQLHKDFLKYRSEQDQKRLNDRDQDSVALIEDAAWVLKQYTKTRSSLDRGNIKAAKLALLEEFSTELDRLFYGFATRALKIYGIAERHLPNQLTMKGRGVPRNRFQWMPSRLQASVNGGATATVATVEAVTGFVTLGIPTALTALACYAIGKAHEVKTNPDGTTISISLNDAQILDMLEILIELIRKLRVMGRGTLPGNKDPNQLRPLVLTDDARIVLEQGLRDELIRYATMRPKSHSSLDESLYSTLKE